MQTNHSFRTSALMAAVTSALALGVSAPCFANSSNARVDDTSLADSMAVGGDTSSTYQHIASPAPQPVQQPMSVATPSDSTATELAAATPARQPLVASTNDLSAALSVASSDDTASVDTPASVPVAAELVAVVITADNTTTASSADLTQAPTAPAQPLTALEPEIITREQVRDELRIARQAGTLSHTGELADTADVLVAREHFNAAQTDAIVAEYRAEQDRQIALAEAESRRAQFEAEALELATLTATRPSDDQRATQVRIEVVDVFGE